MAEIRTPEVGEWPLHEDRDFMENLINQRFNFFLVLFSLFITAAATTTSQQIQTSVLWLGSLICLAVAYTILRADAKHRVIMRALYDDKNMNPAKFQEESLVWFRIKKVKISKFPAFFSARWIVGWFLPFACVAVLAVAAYRSGNGEFRPDSEQKAEASISRIEGKLRNQAAQIDELKKQLARGSSKAVEPTTKKK